MTQQQPQYGATTGSEDDPEGVAPLGWESRGTVLGLLVDIGSGFGYHFVMLVGLQVTIGKLGDQLMHCNLEEEGVGANTGVNTAVGAGAVYCVCEYTKAFLLTFPAAASAAFALMLGRDLLQKRLYYGLLKAGGVLRFAELAPWKDPIMIFVMVSFGHCAWFVGYAFIIVFRKMSLAESTQSALMESVEHLSAAIAVMVPATLMVVFCYLGYDIQKSLVPLSEYVHDAVDPTHSLKELHVVRESGVRAVVEACQVPPTARGTKYAMLLDAYCGRFGKHSRAESTSQMSGSDGARFGLLQSLWPAGLLLRTPASSTAVSAQSRRTFLSLWQAVTGIVCVWMLLVASSLLSLLQVEISELALGHWAKLFPLGVIVANFAVLGYAFQAFLQTVSIWSGGGAPPACGGNADAATIEQEVASLRP